MQTLALRIANLPPEKRALLEFKLRQTKAAQPPVEQNIPRRKTDAALPLSFAQERLWFLDQLEPGSSFYNLARSLSLEGALDVEGLRKALSTIVGRHEALRTTIRVEDGDPIQVVGEHKVFLLPVMDLSGSESRVEDSLRRILDVEVQRPFDLSRDLLLRATLLKTGPATHVLLLVTHHIASDAWSNGVLLQELSKLYGAFLNGELEALPELPIQYADFAIWQRLRLNGGLLKNQLSYWKTQLSDISVLQLPTDRPRPAIQSYRGATRAVKLPKSLSLRLEDLSRKEGVTLFMTLLAAFQTLLYRYSGQEDVTLGSPIAGRIRPETEGLIGMFINTLVLRSNLSGNPGFRELLDRVRRMALQAYEHQDLPFERLVGELHPTRDLSRSPLFQVMFAFQNVPRQTFELAGLRVSDLATPGATATFDLSLYAWNDNDGLTATLEYNTDLFDAATIERMLGHFETLLLSVVSTPDQRISDLEILTEGEKRQLLVEWNDTRADYPGDSVHELFEEQVERSPSAVAVVFEGKELTYRELNTKANQLACCLRNLGVGPETLVGISLERSLEMVVGLLGILKAGAAYVPLDPAYPKERLRFILENSQVKTLLTQQSLLPHLSSEARVLCVDRDREKIAQQSVENLKNEGSPDDLANVIYTSGSTGWPKGVQIPHRAMVNFLGAMQKQQQLTDRDTLLAVTTLSFDIAGLELLLPLVTGGRVVLASREAAMDGAQLIELLHVSGATVMQATPATWQLLMESGWQGSSRLRVLCGGEALSRDLATQLLRRCSSLWNMYGPTETTIWSTSHPMSAADGFISVGRPVANTQIYILSPNLQPVPIGVPGELHIGGAGLARGYLHRAELTAEKFIPNPFSVEAGGRLYKTGDLARYLPNGNIDILGRIDHQVKIRGFRIEPGEIEAVLTEYPDILQAVVVPRGEIAGERKLVAYVTTRQDRALEISEVNGFLRMKLPDYMVPSAFVLLDELPHTPNGKIDRAALPMPDSTRLAPEESFVAARNHVERQIANIWEKILGVQPVGVKDNFFDLGGYSLLAVRVMSQIEKVFGKKLPVTALFQMPSVEQLAQLLRQEVKLAPWSSLVPLQPNGSRSPFFWVHGEVSDAFLPRYLGPGQPLYGILHQGHDGKPARYTGVREIAAHYLSEIRTVQARGPYFIGGYCFGGMLAFEMAQQLKSQNEEVALLVLVAPSSFRDDRVPDGADGPDEDAGAPSNKGASLRHELFRHSRNVKRLSARQRLSYVLTRVSAKAKDVWRITSEPVWKKAETIACMAYLSLGRILPPSLRSPYILKVYFKAIEAYKPQVYPGRVVIFRANPRWRALIAGGVEIHEVTGSHTDILKEPHVRVWAEGLKSCLEEAQSSISAII